VRPYSPQSLFPQSELQYWSAAFQSDDRTFSPGERAAAYAVPMRAMRVLTPCDGREELQHAGLRWHAAALGFAPWQAARV
jgi:hypothetical protein